MMLARKDVCTQQNLVGNCPQRKHTALILVQFAPSFHRFVIMLTNRLINTPLQRQSKSPPIPCQKLSGDVSPAPITPCIQARITARMRALKE